MSQDDVRAALQSAAEALQTSARTHKEEEFRHRKSARRLQRELNRLERVCAQHGIELQTVPAKTPKEGHSHG